MYFDIYSQYPDRMAIVFGGNGTLTKFKRNLSVDKRFPAQPVFITQVFFSYRLSTLICAYKKDLE